VAPLEEEGSAYPEAPLLDSQDHEPSTNTTNDELADSQSNEDTEEEDDDTKGLWSEGMKECLVTTLQEVFTNGVSAENSFETSTFNLAAERVSKLYKGDKIIDAKKCKNKWTDYKKKWGPLEGTQ